MTYESTREMLNTSNLKLQALWLKERSELTKEEELLLLLWHLAHSLSNQSLIILADECKDIMKERTNAKEEHKAGLHYS